MSTQNYTVNFFDGGKVKQGGLTQTRKISGTNLMSAVLTYHLKTGTGAVFKAIRFNGSLVVASNLSDNAWLNGKKIAEGTVDVTHLVSLNGNNTVNVEVWQGALDALVFTAVETLTVQLNVVASGVTQQEAPTSNVFDPRTWKIPSWLWGIIILLVVIGLVWFLFKTPNGAKVTNIIKDGGRQLAKTVGGS